MQNVVTLIFPHQLFENHPALAKGRPVYLIEEWLFFKQYKFHKQKLVLHRASMKSRADRLRKKKYSVHYVSAQEATCDIRKLIKWLSASGVQEVHFADVVDDWLERRIMSSCARHNIKPVEYPTPNFLTSRQQGEEYFANTKKYFLTKFYIEQRKQLSILLDANGKPVGGQWSFDADNRAKLKKGTAIPQFHIPNVNAYVAEARAYVGKSFSSNYGTTEEPFDSQRGFYPITAAEADEWLEDFLKRRFADFGKYEDAMVANEHVLFHSVLTPMLNIGLLDPNDVVERALRAATKYHVPINSVEGFIRQVIGWREFIRIVYEQQGRTQRTRNFWGFTRKIPKTFWTGETGIAPVDCVVAKVLRTGYCHHIERLMVLGNFMVLCEFDPDDVYRWFMEMFIDSYDWVMVPNVYGMSQFADGGVMSTKPYISGSNYLMKMSDFPKGSWQETWDALFWRFMHVHREFFLRNPRLSMLVRTFDRMPKTKQVRLLATADRFLETL